jgi:hypothetical protein
MPQYEFEAQLVISPDAGAIVLADALVTLYDPTDTAMTSPLDLLDTTGLPMDNPLTASANGFIPAFSASVPQVMWVGGDFAGYINSFKSVLDAALAAQAAAEAAAAAAAGLGGGGGSVGTTGGSVQYVRKSGSTWPARPTSDATVVVLWIGADPSPAIVTTGTSGMRDNIDLRFVTP